MILLSIILEIEASRIGTKGLSAHLRKFHLLVISIPSLKPIILTTPATDFSKSPLITNESRISLPDNVIQTVFWFVLSQSFHSVVISLFLGLLQFPQKYLELSELPYYRFMKQKSNIFLIIKRLNFADISFLCSFPISWLPWKDSFQNAETPEILKIQK